MIKQYLKFAIRNISRNKSYSIISILGLSIGMAVFFLISSFVLFEMKFESSEKNASKIYNVYWSDAKGESSYGTSPYILAKVFRENYSNIAACAQISEEFDYGRLKVSYKGNEMNPGKVFYAEPQILDILSFRLSSGSLNNFKENINAVLLSESAVQKYFSGKVSPGSIIQMKSAENIEDFLVSGIIKDRPEDSHFRPDFLFTMSYFKSKMPAQYIDDWGVNNPVTYFKLHEGIASSQLLSVIRNIQSRFMPEFRKKDLFKIIPLNDIHLYSSNVFGFFGQRGSLEKVYIFTFIGFLILIIACINFVNLNTARASLRIKEIGIRKMLGASRMRLFFQIIFESILFSLISLPVAFLFMEFSGDLFFETMNREVNVFTIFSGVSALYLFAVPLLMGITSGLLTAIYSLKNISVEDIHGRARVISSGNSLRRLLIGFQFIVFIGLIIGSIVIYKQMNMMMKEDLGYDKNNLLIIDRPDEKYTNGITAFVDELKNQNSIVNVSYTSSLPPSVGNTIFNQIASPITPGELFDAQLITCDENYLPTMKLQLLEGENFKDANSNTKDIIINEIAAKKLGFKKSAIGERVIHFGGQFRIIGVIKNFFSQSLYRPMTPVILQNSSMFSYKIAIRYRPNELLQAIRTTTKTWKSFFNQSVLNISFSDKELQKVYDNDVRFSETIFLFTVISIFISIIGLASLAAITSARRKKEIGIRKVVGASVPDIMKLLSKEILYISIISTLIAWPITYYLINKWLSNFAYRVDLTILYPLFAFAAGLLIALVTISFHAYRAASMNPIESIRYE
ncbi:MAG: FtsX-like permease family protein [Ignavibacteriaceae bacterium]|jgi:putative ABC transport system permease protein